MRLLDRYFLRELLVPLAYCLGGFLIFWVSFDLIGELAEFQRRRLQGGDVAQYYLLLLPELLVTVLPIALLLALLYALTHHARHHEYTAARAAGIGLWRLCLPYLGVGVLFSLGVFALNELWVPRAQERAERVLTRRDPALAEGKEGRWVRNLVFHNERHRRRWYIGLYDRDTGQLWNANIDWELENGMIRRLAAQHGVFTNGVWLFHGVQQLFFTPAPEPKWEPSRSDTLELVEFSETPAHINSEIRFATLSNVKAAARARLALREIADYQQLHPSLPAQQRFKLETQFYGRWAEPWTSLVVVLVAIPFGTPSGRRNVFVGVAASIFIAFAYFVTQRFALALGTGGYLPPWLAAWSPNVVFGLVGVLLTLRVR